MSCVNKNNKEFVQLAKELDIDKDVLASIIYSWQADTGKDGEFPSKEYIKKKLAGKSLTDANDAQVSLWKKYYRNIPMFSSLEQAMRIVKNAQKIFGKESVMLYKTNNGRYKINVARPVTSKDRAVYQVSSDREYNVKTLKEHYKVSIDTPERKRNYEDSIKELKSFHQKHVYYKRNGETTENLKARVSRIASEIKNRAGWAIKNIYVVDIKNGTGFRIQINFKTHDDIVNDKLSIIDNLSDDAVASEALRLEQESRLNEEYYINPKKVDELKNQVKKKNRRILDSELEEAFKFLQELENNKDLNQYVAQCITWLKNDTISLPRDSFKVEDAFMTARKLGIDTGQFKSPMDVLIWAAQQVETIPGEIIEPSKIKELHFNRTEKINGKQVNIYDVDDSEEGQLAVANILAAAAPKFKDGTIVGNSPWCLTTFNYNKDTKKATLTSSAGRYWKRYSNGKRQIAIVDGKPIAFNSSRYNKDEWWDFYDGDENNHVGYNNIKDINLNSTGAYYKSHSDTEKYVAFNGVGYSYEGDSIKTIDNNITNSNGDVQIRIYEYKKRNEKSFTYENDNKTLEIWMDNGVIGKHCQIIFHNDITYDYNKLGTNAHSIFFSSLDTGDIIKFTIPSYRNNSITRLAYNADKECFYIYGKKEKFNYDKVLEFSKEQLSEIQRTLENWYLVPTTNKDISRYENLDKVNNFTNILTEYIESYIKDLNSKYYEAATNGKDNYSEEAHEKNEIPTSTLDEITGVEVENSDNTTNQNDDILTNIEENPNTPNTLTEAADAIVTNNTVNTINENRANYDLPYTSDTESIENNNNLEYSQDNEEIPTIKEEELSYIGNEVEYANETEDTIQPKTILDTLSSLREDAITKMYNDAVKKPFNEELSKVLRSILSEYHFEVIEGDLKRVFGDDTLGALDILQKIVYLADKGDINAITEPEEFAHAFVELMGSAYHRKGYRDKYATTEYSELRDLVEKTDFYKQVLEQYKDVYKYDNGTTDLVKVKKEAVGKALAAVITNRFEAKTEAEKSFVSKLKQWFNDVLLWVKSFFKDSDKLQRKLNNIADSIFDGTYAEKYLDKVKDASEYKLVNYQDTLLKQTQKDGGKALSIIQKVQELKGVITGSLAYRAQGTTYRKESETLHDLDFVVNENNHNIFLDHPSLAHITQHRMGKWTLDMITETISNTPYMRTLREKIPNLTTLYAYPGPKGIISNNIVCEDAALVEKFKGLEGNFNKRLEQLTQEERDKIYLVDLFFNRGEAESYKEPTSGVNMTNYKVSFEEKLKMGRAKDIFDYQNFNPRERQYKVTPSMMYQKKEIPELKEIKGSEIAAWRDVASMKDKVNFKKIKVGDIQYSLRSNEGRLLYDIVRATKDNNYINDANDNFISDASIRGIRFEGAGRFFTDKSSLWYLLDDLNGDADGMYSDVIHRDNTKKGWYVSSFIKDIIDVVKNTKGDFINELAETLGFEDKFERGTASAISYLVYEIYDKSNTISKYIDAITLTYEPKNQLEIDFGKPNTTIEDNKENMKPDSDKALTPDSQEQAKKNPLETDEYTKRMTRVMKQIDTLMDSDLLTSTEVRHIAELAVYWISDHLTELQTNPTLGVETYGDILKDVDLTSMSRLDIVNKIGIENIINLCKEKLRPEANTDNPAYNSRSTIRKARLITENFDAIMTLASNVFSEMEKFTIIKAFDGTNTVTQDYDIDADNPNDSEKSDDINEIEGSQQEHWMLEQRTIDVMNKMSAIVRDAIRQCYVLDENGNKVRGLFGIYERVNPRQAVKSILRWGQGARSLSELVSKLQAQQKNNPWVSQIIDRLQVKKGEKNPNADFQSQFWAVSNNHFQAYSIVKLDDGKWVTMPVNENPANKEALQSIKSMYNLGQHPLFDNNMINQDAYDELVGIQEQLKDKTVTEENKSEIAEALGYLYHIMGYPVTTEMVENIVNQDNLNSIYSSLSYIINTLEANLDNETFSPFNFRGGIQGNLSRLLKPITDTLEDSKVSSFYDSGKMYQSYVTPSFLSTLFSKFKNLKGEDFINFLYDEYGQYDFFRRNKDDKSLGYNFGWLKMLAKDDKAREIFRHKVQLNFNGKNYMRNMSDIEYSLSVLAEYGFSNTSKGLVPAFFRMPMQSNKPTSEFIQFYSYRGNNYKDSIASELVNLCIQELNRIQTVKMREESRAKGELSEESYIESFDENGKKFCFLTFLNPLLEDSSSTFGKLMRDKINGENIDASLFAQEAKEAIIKGMDEMAAKVVAKLQSQGIFDNRNKIEGLGNTDAEVHENLMNFAWNDAYATMNILQMTVTDLAYYKNAEDVQKRLAQLHAPGVRGNVEATDYDGNPVTDGRVRTFYLNDEVVVSNVIDNITEVFDRKIANAKNDQERRGLEGLKDYLVGENGVYRKVNVTDGQAFNSPTSYRKKALIFGKWSTEKEEIYNKLLEGTYSYTDIQAAFGGVNKPFTYGSTTKKTGVDAPLTNLKVGVQNKNSEYLLIMADAILRNEKTGRPNLLRAIYDVMEETHVAYENGKRIIKTNGIDTVQFNSAVKTGPMTAVNLNEFSNIANGEELAKNAMREAIYEYQTTTVTEPDGTEHEIKESTGNYNKDYVQDLPLDSYCMQQEVPEHFRKHEQSWGSQLRYIVISELEAIDYQGNEVSYNVDGVEYSASGLKAEYERIAAENIEESINTLAKDLGLYNSTDRITRNIAISKVLQREILSSPRYGVDLLQAVTLNDNGDFRIPLGDPVQSKRIEQLLNSIIKNRVNKQEIAGGPVVQVANFGTNTLSIKFKSKEGGLLLTRSEWEAKNDKEKYKTYEDYIKDNQAGIAYMECYAPIYTNELFNKFADSKGIINVQAIEMLEPELLKLIGYRIPTEDKYSAAPLKIIGFLPREAGEGIMLPKDITAITGSDFDVDKEYLMHKVYDIYDNKEVKDSQIYRMLYDSIMKYNKDRKVDKKALRDMINQFLDDPFNKDVLSNVKTTKGEISIPRGVYKIMLNTYMKNKYVVKPNAKAYRNNRIIDMTYTVLTHETSMDKILNPQGFEEPKKVGYMIEAYKTTDLSWEELGNMSVKQLKNIINKDKNLCFFDVQSQFYKQNAAAASLIGIFAVSRIAHAVLESSNNYADVNGQKVEVPKYELNTRIALKLKPKDSNGFKLAGLTFGDKMAIDMRYDIKGNLIGKVLGSLVGSAADAVKDPILNLMNINNDTVNILTTLVRLRMPFDDVAMFLSQKAITDTLNDYYKRNASGYISLNDLINEKISNYESSTGINRNSEIFTDFTREEILKGIKYDDDKLAYKALIYFARLQNIANALRLPSTATRVNSVSNAVGPLVVDNLMWEYKVEDLNANTAIESAGRKIKYEDIINEHPILRQFNRAYGMARELLKNSVGYSRSLTNVLDLYLSSNIGKSIVKDRALFNKFVDFFESYMLLDSGVIDSSELKYYAEDFAREFVENDYQEKYKDNALISAIKFDVDKSERVYLKVETTGEDITYKEQLGAAWDDLYKKDPELAMKLFKYNFFRGGIGFNPKTFMSLLTIKMKENIPNYIETFRRLSVDNTSYVMDQFVRNNADNNKLVPIKDIRKLKGNFEVDYEDGKTVTYTITNPDVLKEMKETLYFKTKDDAGNITLYRQTYSDKYTSIYEVTSLLGDNKSYLEISKDNIKTPLVETTQFIESAESDGIESKKSEDEGNTDDIDLSTTQTDADNLATQLGVDNIRNTEREATSQIVNNLREKGINTSEESIDRTKDEQNACK